MKGDTLLKVAIQYGVRVNELAYMNNITPDTIFLDQVRFQSFSNSILKVLKVPNKEARE
jgi:LysM repeat protein